MPDGVAAIAAAATSYARHNAAQHAQEMPEKQSSLKMTVQISTLTMASTQVRPMMTTMATIPEGGSG